MTVLQLVTSYKTVVCSYLARYIFIVYSHIFAGTERGYLVTKHIPKQETFLSFVLILFEVKFEKLILLL